MPQPMMQTRYKIYTTSLSPILTSRWYYYNMALRDVYTTGKRTKQYGKGVPLTRKFLNGILPQRLPLISNLKVINSLSAPLMATTPS